MPGHFMLVGPGWSVAEFDEVDRLGLLGSMDVSFRDTGATWAWGFSGLLVFTGAGLLIRARRHGDLLSTRGDPG